MTETSKLKRKRKIISIWPTTPPKATATQYNVSISLTLDRQKPEKVPHNKKKARPMKELVYAKSTKPTLFNGALLPRRSLSGRQNAPHFRRVYDCIA